MSRWGVRGRSFIAFVRLGRPQFLVGGFLLYGLGAAGAAVQARASGAGGWRFDVTAYLLGQAAITAIQLMTHYANDYFDLAADQANKTSTRWSGGSRVLPSGVLSPRLALRAARFLAVVAVVLVAIIGWQGRQMAVGVLLLAQFLAWFYSAPPLVLHSRGLGEMTTALVVTGLTPLAGFLVQAGDAALGGLATLGAALWPLVGLQFVMLLAIEFPDAAGDAAVGKRTLVVRLGGARAAALYRAVLVAVYGALPLFALVGAPRPVMLAAALPAPLAAWQFWRLGNGAWGVPSRWESLAFLGVFLLIATAAAELAAFLWMLSQ